jgi:hypothetical protein
MIPLGSIETLQIPCVRDSSGNPEVRSPCVMAGVATDGPARLGRLPEIIKEIVSVPFPGNNRERKGTRHELNQGFQ